jgi:hypothetical protein
MYLGSYFECSGQKNPFTYSETRFKCCGNHKITSNFCSKCGSKEFEIIFKKVEQPLDVVEFFNEELSFHDVWNSKSHIYTANFAHFGYIRTTDKDHFKIQKIELTEDLIVDNRTGFLSKFFKHMETLKEQYNSVELKFGLLN